MSQSPTGGLGPARGTGLESRILAWLGCHMLAHEALPEKWAPGGATVTAIGGQIARPIDDVGAMTSTGGHLLVQSKAHLNLGIAESSPLAKAMRQVVTQCLKGIPADSEDGTRLRDVDPRLDRLLIVTDHSAPKTVRVGLVTAADALSELADELPFTDVQGDKDVIAARDVLLEHLRREWETATGHRPTDADLRAVFKVLRVIAVDLDDDGSQQGRALLLLERALDDPSVATLVWPALTTRCHELAERKHWARLDRLRDKLTTPKVVFGPDPRHSRDITTLRQANATRIARLNAESTMPAPEGAVALRRDIEALLTSETGNLALVGAAGCGKTTAALHAAQALLNAGEDVLFLSGDTLAGSAAEARAELGITEDLPSVLLGWLGPGRATLFIDGLDITRLSESSTWLINLVTGLNTSRWRVIATVRSHSLRNGPRWKNAFAGSPADPTRQDPSLSKVRHLLLDGLTDSELAPLLANSPLMASLLRDGHPALATLLRNPFNLKIATELLRDHPTADVGSIRTRQELLSLYWQHRVSDSYERHARRKVLTTLTEQMINNRRPRVTDPGSHLEAALLETYDALLSRDVLREDPPVPWADVAPVGYSHPVLFDYAVAVLVLARPDDPQHLLTRLNADPDLAVVVRPSLDLHLAALWHADPSREVFWTLATSLDAGENGHALASLAAVAACLHDGIVSGDLDVLASACEGSGPLRARTIEARRLVAQLGGALVAKDLPIPRREAAVPVLTNLAARLAAHAVTADDVSLAHLATVVLHRINASGTTQVSPALEADRHHAAADAITVALADPSGAGRAQLAINAAELLVPGLLAQPAAHSALVTQLCATEVLDAWGPEVLRRLLGKLPELAAAAPALATQLATRVWTYETTSDGSRTLSTSRITSLSTTITGDLEMARYTVGHKFPATLRSAPDWSVDYFLHLVVLKAPPWPINHPRGGRPAVRRSQNLAAAGGHGVLTEMAKALAAHLASGEQHHDGEAQRLLNQLAHDLTHPDVWITLLNAATGSPTVLGRALLPLLMTGQILTDSTTLPHAAALVTALSPVLSDREHAELEQRLNDLSPSATADMYLGRLARTRIQTTWATNRLAALEAHGGAPPAPDVPRDISGGFTRFPLGSALDPAHATDQDKPLLTALDTLNTSTQAAQNGGINDPTVATRLRQSMTRFLCEFDSRYSQPPPDIDDTVYPQAVTNMCRAADVLTHDPQLLPDTDLGRRVLATLLQYVPRIREAAAELES